MNNKNLFLQAVALLKERDWQKLLASARELLDHDDRVSDYHFLLGSALHGLGQFSESIFSLKKAVEIQPAHVAALATLGDSLRELGQWQEAYDCLMQGLEKSPNHNISLRNMALLLCQWPGISDDELRKARTLSARALELNNKESRNAYVFAYSLHKNGNYEEASLILKELSATLPNDPEVLALSAARTDIEPLSAELLLRKAVSFQPNFAEAHLNLGRILFVQGKNTEALDSIYRGLVLKPFLPIGHFLNGVCLAAMKRFTDASDAFAESLRLQPNQPRVLASLGDALRQSGRVDEACGLLDKAVTQYSNDTAILVNYATCLQARGDVSIAIEYYELVLSIDPNNLQSLNNLGRIYLDRLEFRDAEKCFRHALSIAHTELKSTIVANFSRALIQLDRVKEAEDLLEPYWETNKQESSVGIALLDLRMRQERFSDAQVLVAQLMHLFMTDSEVQIRCAELKLSLGEESYALKILQEAEKTSVEPLRITRVRIKTMSKMGMHAEAVELASKVANETRALKEDFMSWADACETAGLFDQALIALEEACVRFNQNFDALINLMHYCIRRENWSRFDAVREEIIARFPKRPAAYGLSANGLQLRDRTKEAIELVRMGLDQVPSDIGLRQQLLGLLIVDNQQDEALSTAKSWASTNPTPRLLELLADVCEKSRKYSEAVDAVRRIIHLQPDRMAAYRNLARLQQLQGNELDALNTLRNALRYKPNDSNTRAFFINVLLATEHLEEAETLAKAERARSPDEAYAFRNLIRVLSAKQRWDEAEKVARKLHNRFPKDPFATSPLYRLLVQRGRLDEARKLLEKAIETSSTAQAIKLALIDHDFKHGNPQNAIATCRSMVEEKGWLSEHAFKLFDLYLETGNFVNAENVMREILRLRPRHPKAYSCLARLYGKMKYLRKTEEVLRKAIREQPTVAQHYIDLAKALADRGDFDEYLDLYRKAMSLLGGAKYAMLPAFFFVLNCHPNLTAEEIFKEYRMWADYELARYSRPNFIYAAKPLSGRRLRVGYVSPDFRRHAVAKFSMPLLSNHDHKHFEIFAYSHLEPGQADEVTTRFQEVVDHWVDITQMENEELIRCIRRDAIDVLVDLAGHTSNNKLAAFHMKPAPVQISFIWGAGQTTGVPGVDYLFGDDICLPSDHSHCISERIEALPHGFAFEAPKTPEINSLPVLNSGVFTFACLSRSIRVSQLVIDTWARVLHAVPASRLLLDAKPYEEAEMCDWISKRFESQGIKRERLLFRNSKSYWHIFHDIDIALDPFPAGSGTILTEGLWMGVPSVSLVSRPPMGRIGASVLASMKMHDWIASSTDEYVNIAKNMASDLTALANLRLSLREKFLSSPLSDHKAYAQSVEKAYMQNWDFWASTARQEVNT